MPPGWAITGRPIYLLTGDTNTPATWTRTTPLGLLSVTAHGVYTVNWGDGSSPTGPYSTPGAPWPTGTITHVYDNVGGYTITVEETWTATWALAGAGGTLTTLHTTGTVPGYPVHQIQAVVTGGN